MLLEFSLECGCSFVDGVVIVYYIKVDNDYVVVDLDGDPLTNPDKVIL